MMMTFTIYNSNTANTAYLRTWTKRASLFLRTPIPGHHHFCYILPSLL